MNAGSVLCGVLLVMAMGLTACGPKRSSDPLKPPRATTDKPVTKLKTNGVKTGTATDKDRLAAAAANAPEVYMALQPDPNGVVSIVFAIDGGRDANPTNDPAIRLTPEEGKCNPQELRSYDFAGEASKRPIFGPEMVKLGVTAKDLPVFMASAVSSEMIRQKLAADVKGTQPQNVCTRKLWERLIVNQSRRTG